MRRGGAEPRGDRFTPRVGPHRLVSLFTPLPRMLITSALCGKGDHSGRSLLDNIRYWQKIQGSGQAFVLLLNPTVGFDILIGSIAQTPSLRVSSPIFPPPTHTGCGHRIGSLPHHHQDCPLMKTLWVARFFFIK